MEIDIKDLTDMMFQAESNLLEIDGKDASTYHLAYTALLDIFKERLEEHRKELDVLRERWVKENGTE